jgi:hypothetical protein
MADLYSRAVIREDGIEFMSVREAEKFMNSYSGGIGAAIKRNGKCKGYKWSFKHPRVWNHPPIEGEKWENHPTLPIKVSDHGRVKHRGRITPGTTSDIEPIHKQIVVLKNRYDVGLLVIQTFFDYDGHHSGYTTYKRINNDLLDNNLSNFELYDYNACYTNPISGMFFNRTHESHKYYMI